MSTPFSQQKRQDFNSFATKTYVDTNITSNTVVLQVKKTALAIPVSDHPSGGNFRNVTTGRPQLSNANSSNGLIDELTVEIVKKSATSKFIIDVYLFGMWNDDPQNKAVILGRQVGSGSIVALPGAEGNSQNRGTTMCVTQTALPTAGTQNDNTMDGYTFRYCDSGFSAPAGSVVKYSPVVVNTKSNTARYHINATIEDNDVLSRERAVSTVIVSEVELA